MAVVEKDLTQPSQRKMSRIEVVGMVLVILSAFGLFMAPEYIAGIFDAMVKKVVPIVVNVYLTGMLGVAIILSVLTGRILERLGFTDALVRIFSPVTAKIGINPTVVIPAIYNILGDINAAGRICGPALKRAGATKDEQKIAVATMVQFQQSFSTFMLGLLALTKAGIAAFPVIFFGIIAPIVIAPWLLAKTIWRNTKSVKLQSLPSFTPDTKPLPTLFGAAKEGAELLFLLLIPAAAVIFAIIGALEYVGIWRFVESGLTIALSTMSIDPKTGILSVLASPTLAMNTLKDTAASLPPQMVVGSFLLAASGFPLQIIFGQIPAIWSGVSDLTEKEAMNAAIIGIIMRIISATALAFVLTPLIVK